MSKTKHMTTEQELSLIRRMVEKVRDAFTERRGDVVDLMNAILDLDTDKTFKLESRHINGTFEYAGDKFQIEYDTETTLMEWRLLATEDGVDDSEWSYCVMTYDEQSDDVVDFNEYRYSVEWSGWLGQGSFAYHGPDYHLAQQVYERLMEVHKLIGGVRPQPILKSTKIQKP